MSPKRRLIARLITILLWAGMFLPLSPSVSAADLYFTAINDSVCTLTSDTMPFWSGGLLYVPYTVFDPERNSTGVNLGLYVSYSSRARTTVTLYNRSKVLVFDLNEGNCRDDVTGEVYSYRAIVRNGVPYLPLAMVCPFFGLTYTYNSLSFVPRAIWSESKIRT